MRARRNSALRRMMVRTGLAGWLAPLLAVSAVAAPQAGATRDDLDDYLDRLVTEVRASTPDLESYEPFVVLHVVHDERGYRVQASDLLERRLTEALAAQGVRVIDPMARQRILDELEACYTEQAPFCRAADVVGRFQTAGGVFEGSVLPVRGGVELRLKLVVAAGAADLSPGEILGTWSVVVPPPALDPELDLLPVAGIVSYGRPGAGGDSTGARVYGELRIDVRTRDGSEAWVLIDGRVSAPAPVTTTTTAGRHLVTVTASGYRPFSDYVNVPPRGVLRREIILERGVGDVWVRSNAAVAVVYFDGKRAGTTPWRGKRIETGPHSVRVEKQGYVPYTLDFVLEHEEEERIYAELEELPGDIVITCLQDDISIFLDEASRGVVGKCGTGRSLTLKDVAPGRHRIWGARGPDRTDTIVITVKGGAAVPVSLGLRLDLPEDVRAANERRSKEEFEPFGGYGWKSGLYIGVGLLYGRAAWDMTLADTSGRFEVNGPGVRLGAAVLLDPWRIDAGFDILSLAAFGAFDARNRYIDTYVGVTYLFFPQSSIRPFIGLRGNYNTVSFAGDQRERISAGALGLGASGGAAVRVSRNVILELGATYSWSAGREFVEDGGTSGPNLKLGSMGDLQAISGQAAVSLTIGPD